MIKSFAKSQMFILAHHPIIKIPFLTDHEEDQDIIVIVVEVVIIQEEVPNHIAIVMVGEEDIIKV